MCLDPPNSDALAIARKTVLRQRTGKHLQTLAMALAESGQVTEATKILKEARESLKDPTDFLVQGRIAEQCGLVDTARDFYRKFLAQVPEKKEIQAAVRGSEAPLRYLAERRLAALPK
jgi:tetratricopeptide (TPR) repeat protein